MNLTNNQEVQSLQISERDIGELDQKQNNFLETTLGKIVNTAIDFGISMLVPDLIDDQVIDIKNAIIKNGFEEGVQTAISSAINLGKSALGMITGNFEDISQAQSVVKNGGLLDNISDLLDTALNKAKEGGLLDNGVYQVIKKGKNTIVNQIENNITEEFGKQTQNIEYVGKYINQWKDYYKNQDFEGMQREYDKIQEKMKELLPLEKTLIEVRQLENLHEMIKNNDQKFNLIEEQIKLAEILI